MPIKRVSFSEYEEASGLQRGRLWGCLSVEEQTCLIRLGYRSRCQLPNGALEYLMQVFPLPDHLTELVSMTQYEKKCGFSKGELRALLSEEQHRQIELLGYRSCQRLPYRVILHLKSLGFY